MDAKEIKAALKAAREAIRSKEFKDALKHCKAILKADKTNYNALVFVGVAADGLDQSEQAIMAYKKATEVAPDNPLAWQGLCGFYEKSANKKTELTEVYSKLLTMYTDPSDADKVRDVSLKLASLYMESRRVPEAYRLYSDVLGEMSGPGRTDVVHRMVAAMERLGTLTDEQNAELIQHYEELVQADSLEPEMWTTYLKLLKKCGAEKAPILAAAQRCHEKCPTLIMALEYLARIHLDDSIQDPSASSQTSGLLEKLTDVIPDHGYTELLSGLLVYNSGQYVQARTHLTNGLEKLKTNVSGWFYLSQSLLKLHAYNEAHSSARQGAEHLKNPKVTFYGDPAMTSDLYLLCEGRAGVYAGQATRGEAEKSLDELASRGYKKADVALLRAEIRLLDNKPAEALEILDQNELLGTTAEAVIMDGRCQERMGRTRTAVELYNKALSLDPDSPQAHYCVGRFLYDTRKQTTGLGDCLIHLLKAAKLDPYYSNTFLYLGKYYENIMKDISKASRCYQKAFDTDSTNEEAGSLLIDSLIAAGQQERAILMLKTVTKKASAGCAKWAWLRLGLHLMTSGEHTEAIFSLQCALRADPADVHCWECLGEAYFTRGSYTAALKAFTKATELDPDAVFCFYQMATIKQALGEYDEAVAEYRHLLDGRPEYVPALKGLGETYVLMAKDALKLFFHGRAVDYCQLAIDCLTRAATSRPDLACVWKLLGDACTVLYPAPEEKASILMPAKLIRQAGAKDDKVKVTKKEILATGAKCYGMALKQQPNCSSLWHDLGLNYHYQSQHAAGDKPRKTLLSAKALQCLQRAVRCDPTNHRHWLTLGVIAATMGLPGLAQHCFIRSVGAEANNVRAWASLGALYLAQGAVRPAHEAFSVAQSLEPDYVASWVGQAMVAETIGDQEAMDLFRHTTELGGHTEGAIGYSHWVCRTLLAGGAEDYAITQMAAIPAATDALSGYVDRVKTDPVAYNLLGLLLERQGLYKPAADAFRSAVDLSNGTGINQDTRINLARAMCLSRQAEESIAVYGSLDLSTGDLAASHGLALYKAGRYEESITAYEHALNQTSSEGDKSHIQAAIGMAAHALGDVDRAKAALFEGFRLSPPSIPGLEALLSIGLLQRDPTLSAAVLEELRGTGGEQSARVTALAAEVIAMSQSVHFGRASLQRAIHRDPTSLDLWRRLAEFLMRHEQERSSAAEACIRAAGDTTDKKPADRLLRSLAALGAGLNHPPRGALSQAQTALFDSPDNLSTSFALLAALHADSQLRGAGHSSALGLTTALMAKVEAQLSDAGGNRLTALHVWCVRHYVVALLAAGRSDQAVQFLKQAAWLYEDDIHLQGLTALTQQDFSALRKLVNADASGFVPQALVALYASHDLISEAETAFHQWLDGAETRPAKLLCLVRLAQFAYERLDSGDRWLGVFQEAAVEALKLDPLCVPILLMQGLVYISDKRRAGLAKRSLHRVLALGQRSSAGQHAANVARERLVQLYTKTGDQDALNKLRDEE